MREDRAVLPHFLLFLRNAESMEKEYLDFVKPSTYGNKANPSSCNSLYDDGIIGIELYGENVFLFIFKSLGEDVAVIVE